MACDQWFLRRAIGRSHGSAKNCTRKETWWNVTSVISRNSRECILDTTNSTKPIKIAPIDKTMGTGRIVSQYRMMSYVRSNQMRGALAALFRFRIVAVDVHCGLLSRPFGIGIESLVCAKTFMKEKIYETT